MGMSLRLRLRPNFREPITSGAGFVGREPEVDRLTAVLRQRASATVLVSGHRGVGKTTLVTEAIEKATAENGEGNEMLVAHLSLPHVNPGDSEVSREIRGQILRSLARSLYFAIKNSGINPDKKIRDRAEELYEKTYFRELHEQGQLRILAEAEARIRQVNTTEARFELGKSARLLLGTLGAGAVAVGGVATAEWVAQAHGAWFGLAAFGLILACVVAAGWTASRRTEDETTAAEKLTGLRTTSRSGSFDLSPETLEFDLQELLTNLREAKVRTIFVIDELDKLEVAEAPEKLESHVIFTILASLKNFFTLGSGIYVFISGEDFYARLDRDIEEQSYSLAHTLFTDRLFVHVLPYGDVEKLIDGLLDRQPEDSETYNKFRNFLCWESRNHIFDLLTLVGDFVSEYDGGTPILHAHESHESEGRWHEGNLPDDWILAAALQKCVGATYDEAARPGSREERFNQALWLTLLDVAKELAREFDIATPKDGYDLSESQWTKTLHERDREDIAGSVDRLLARAERYGILMATDAKIDQVTPDGNSKQVDAIEYSLVGNPEYPDSSIGTHSAPSPFENGFLEVAAEVDRIYANLEDADLDPNGYSDGIDMVRTVAKNIRERPNRKSPPRSTVRDALKTAAGLSATLLEQGVHDLIRGWASDKGLGYTNLMAADAQTERPTARRRAAQQQDSSPEAASLGQFKKLREMILDLEVDHALVTASDRENKLLVVQAVDPDIEPRLHDAYQQASSGKKERERRVQVLPIVQVKSLQPENPRVLPREVIDILDEDQGARSTGWLTKWLPTPGPVKRNITTGLLGWNVFELDPSGSNIGELRLFLDKVSYLTAESAP